MFSTISVSFFENSVLYPILNEVVFLFFPLCILDTTSLSVMWLVKIFFPHFVDCLFIKTVVSFATQKLFSFMRRSPLLIVGLNTCDTRVPFRKYFIVPISSSFSSIRFGVSGLKLRALIHLELSFVKGYREGFSFILLHVVVHFEQYSLLKMLSHP